MQAKTIKQMQIMEHFKGLLFTMLTYATGRLLPFFEGDGPVITTWILQNTAFLVTIVLGIFSIGKILIWMKERHGTKNKQKKT